MPKDKVVSVRMSREQRDRLVKLSESRGVCPSDMIRNLIDAQASEYVLAYSPTNSTATVNSTIVWTVKGV